MLQEDMNKLQGVMQKPTKIDEEEDSEVNEEDETGTDEDTDEDETGTDEDETEQTKETEDETEKRTDEEEESGTENKTEEESGSTPEENVSCPDCKKTPDGPDFKTVIMVKNKPIILHFCSLKCLENYNFPKVGPNVKK